MCLCSVNALFSLPSFSIGVDEKLLAEKIENIYQDTMVAKWKWDLHETENTTNLWIYKKKNTENQYTIDALA